MDGGSVTRPEIPQGKYPTLKTASRGRARSRSSREGGAGWMGRECGMLGISKARGATWDWEVSLASFLGL